MSRSFLLLLLAPLAISAVLPAWSTRAAEVVKAGAGSWLEGLPAGAKGPPDTIWRTADLTGPMPTNDWWSSLAWEPFSSPMYPHPLAVKAGAAGLQVSYPGARITANRAAIFGFLGGDGQDLVLGHSKAAAFPDARVAGWSDWFVTAQMGSAETGMRLTCGHGSPFVYADYAGGEPVVTFRTPPAGLAVSNDGATLRVQVDGVSYGLFAPGGSTWQGAGTARLSATTGGKSWFSLAVLPDDQPETLALFQKYAHAHVTDTRVDWSYEAAQNRARSGFTFTTAAREGTETGTLFALYPHQYHAGQAEFTGHTYASVRGPLKLAAGRKFSTSLTLPPVLPSLPLTPSTAREELRKLIREDLAPAPQLTGDTYWLGKQLGKWATLLPLAEQAGDAESAAECSRRIRLVVENFLTATDKTGAPKKAGDGVFARDPRWGSLIGYPASYGSDDQLNDHHFHYGYFLRAAGELARHDAAWAAEWMPMLRMLVRDIASPDRQDPLFPFLRCFDPWAGHTWASGHARFGDGNNNESSSEAVNAWYGLLLLGEATGDPALRDLGAWLFATEISAIEDYWFDVRGELLPRDYPASVVTMVWGGKGANGTWFSASPEAVHGINFLPITAGSLYLGRWPDYARKNYSALVAENLEDEQKKAAATGLPAPDHDGSGFGEWADVHWMYRALTEPADARRLWEARPPGFKPEAGNSLAQTYAWITALTDLGEVDRTVTGNAVFSAVFVKNGSRTHTAWNPDSKERVVTFTDGVTLTCPPGALTAGPE